MEANTMHSSFADNRTSMYGREPYEATDYKSKL